MAPLGLVSWWLPESSRPEVGNQVHRVVGRRAESLCSGHMWDGPITSNPKAYADAWAQAVHVPESWNACAQESKVPEPSRVPTCSWFVGVESGVSLPPPGQGQVNLGIIGFVMGPC